MKRLKAIGTSFLLAVLTLSGIAQNPDFVDPGNVRGDEGTVSLWENPTYYVPVLVVVVLVASFWFIRKRKKKA